MGFNCGIVGLPNVGKSTLFNALLATQTAEAANYPFCTIEPNIGKVSVPDERIEKLAKIANSAQIIPTQLEFVDIAGLVRGASKGEGLGNQFLSHIREVDAIIYMLRCFEDGDITHVEGRISPLDDAEIIETELVLADMESVEKRIANLQKKGKSDKDSKEQAEIMEKLGKILAEGKPARSYVPIDDNERKIIKNFQLLTTKPALYVCNVEEASAASGNNFSREVQAKIKDAPVVVVSARIESEVAQLASEDDKKEFLGALGLEETGLAQVIRAGFSMLELITYFTIGPKEARAWNIKKGQTAPQAAGVIHTDFEKGFIRAETIAYTDYIALNGEQGAKEAGKLRLEGKEYIVQDGDVLHFRFNV
ncbi:MAG: redox-regulated ATPase YchF [Pseudomonadota bacterium]